ncbi:MAG: MarR family transcriptional regulator [Pseudomonadota bacterium]
MVSSPNIFSIKNFLTEESVGYLLSRSRTKLAKALDVALAEYDITNAQGSIVLMLSSGKYSTAAELARELYIDSASVTRMIDRLEKRGLIMRLPRGEDRRVINLRLTPDGQVLAETLPPIYVEVLNRSFAGFSSEELEVLRGLLRRFLHNDTAADNGEA